ncbi:hypothetical protein BD413DRAFT_231015 [Trametes elegans]|nr:hypothetical protein BD413DRAFT_231015 [Trametes elegans]
MPNRQLAITIREVTKLSESEKKSYSKLLASAFRYYFFGGGLAGDNSLQEPILEAHLTAALVDGQGEIHVAELHDAGVVGVAVWFGPGNGFLSTEAQRNAGWNQVMARLPAEYQAWWAEFIIKYEELSERFLGPGVKLGAYHLQVIGVAPEHQRKGVATALLQYAEAKVSIYKASGYSAVGSTPIKGPPDSEGAFDMFVFIKHTEADP